MRPLLRSGTLVFVDEFTYTRRHPAHGEIVAARPTALGGRACVKRVLGLPHERVACDGRAWHLGSDEYFLVGDDVENSLDSRRLGPLHREELIGRVWLRLWPPMMFSHVRAPT